MQRMPPMFRDIAAFRAGFTPRRALFVFSHKKKTAEAVRKNNALFVIKLVDVYPEPLTVVEA